MFTYTTKHIWEFCKEVLFWIYPSPLFHVHYQEMWNSEIFYYFNKAQKPWKNEERLQKLRQAAEAEEGWQRLLSISTRLSYQKLSSRRTIFRGVNLPAAPLRQLASVKLQDLSAPIGASAHTVLRSGWPCWSCTCKIFPRSYHLSGMIRCHP